MDGRTIMAAARRAAEGDVRALALTCLSAVIAFAGLLCTLAGTALDNTAMVVAGLTAGVFGPIVITLAGQVSARSVQAEQPGAVLTHLDLADLAGDGHRELVNDVDVAGDLVMRQLA